MIKNCLNAPVIVATTIGMLSSSVISTPNIGLYPNEYVYQKYTIDDCITSNFSMDVNKKVQRVNLEEDTNITNLMSGLYNTENSRYIIKNNLDGFINGMESIFGEMRYLTEEGQKDYNDNLDELYSDAGVQLFDFI